MRTLIIEVTLTTPDGNPWPLLTAWEEQRDSDGCYIIAEGVRVPSVSQGLDEALRRICYLWRSHGPLAARGYLQGIER